MERRNMMKYKRRQRAISPSLRWQRRTQGLFFLARYAEKLLILSLGLVIVIAVFLYRSCAFDVLT